MDRLDIAPFLLVPFFFALPSSSATRLAGPNPHAPKMPCCRASRLSCSRKRQLGLRQLTQESFLPALIDIISFALKTRKVFAERIG